MIRSLGEALDEATSNYPIPDSIREHLWETPERIAKVWTEFMSGYKDIDKLKFTTFPAGSYDDWIIEKNIEVQSLCCHHMLPFSGVATIAYLPDKLLCGASKLPRVVDIFSHRLQLQENLGEDIKQYLVQHLSPQALVVKIESTHSCVACRGIRDINNKFVTYHTYSTIITPHTNKELRGIVNDA